MDQIQMGDPSDDDILEAGAPPALSDDRADSLPQPQTTDAPVQPPAADAVADDDEQDQTKPDPLSKWVEDGGKTTPKDKAAPPKDDAKTEPKVDTVDDGDKSTEEKTEAPKVKPPADEEDIRLPDTTWKTMPADAKHAWAKLRSRDRQTRTQLKERDATVESLRGDADATKRVREFAQTNKLSNDDVSQALALEAARKGQPHIAMPHYVQRARDAAAAAGLPDPFTAPAPPAPAMSPRQKAMLDEYGLTSDFLDAGEKPAVQEAKAQAAPPPQPQQQPIENQSQRPDADAIADEQVANFLAMVGFDPTSDTGRKYEAELESQLNAIAKRGGLSGSSAIPAHQRLQAIRIGHAAVVNSRRAARAQQAVKQSRHAPISAEDRVVATATGAKDPLSSWVGKGR